MQRYKKEGEEERLFKGSAFVEFASVDDAKAFVAIESIKYNEQELIKMTKSVNYEVNNACHSYECNWYMQLHSEALKNSGHEQGLYL